MLLWLLACTPTSISLKPLDTGDTSSDDSGHSGGDSGETGESGNETGDSDTSDTNPPVEEITDFTLTVDGAVVTMLHAAWTDPGANETWVEYRWEGEEWLVAPLVGVGDAVLLGIPAETEVEAHVVAIVDGAAITSDNAHATTGSLPPYVLVPEIEAYDPSIASSAPWAMVSLAYGDYTYSPPYVIEIFDRQGRVVWYQQTPDSMFTFYPTVAHGGDHIWWEGSNIFGMGSTDPFVTRQTLDNRWSESLDVPGMGQAIAEGPDGSFFYELRGRDGYGLNRLDADGSVEEVWDCYAWMDDHNERAGACYMNTCNWNGDHNSVLASMFESNTVFEIDLTSREPIRQMGQLDVGDPYTFSPAESEFDYQHDPYWLDADTLLVSTHIRGRSGVQVAAEYTVDDARKTVTRGWTYVSTDRWATQVGEAVRLPNGNTTQGYGQDGAVREVTPEGEIAWEASWEKDSQGYRVVGHLSMIEDLYALNQGPTE